MCYLAVGNYMSALLASEQGKTRAMQEAMAAAASTGITARTLAAAVRAEAAVAVVFCAAALGGHCEECDWVCEACCAGQVKCRDAVQLFSWQCVLAPASARAIDGRTTGWGSTARLSTSWNRLHKCSSSLAVVLHWITQSGFLFMSHKSTFSRGCACAI